MSGYNRMGNMPSHGHASNARAGNAREAFQVRRNGNGNGNGAAAAAAANGGAAAAAAPGMAAGRAYEMECHFPSPPPRRVYCHPAAYSSLDGRQHHRLLDAYGASRAGPYYGGY